MKGYRKGRAGDLRGHRSASEEGLQKERVRETGYDVGPRDRSGAGNAREKRAAAEEQRAQRETITSRGPIA